MGWARRNVATLRRAAGAAASRDDEYKELIVRVQMLAGGLRIAYAVVDEALGQQITRWEKVVAQAG